MNNKKNNIAIIPVRKNSTRVPRKGFRRFGDTTLLDMKINTLLKCGLIDKILVSTDSEEAKEIARNKNIPIHHREDYFASSRCTGSEFFENLARSVKESTILYCPPTSPFLTVETIEKAISAFNQTDHDSVATVAPVKHHLWKDGRPLNYDIQNSPNSQDLPNIVRLTYGVCISTRENILKFRNVVGRSPLFLEVNEIEAIDIDTQEDFRYAEYIKKGRNV